MLTLLLRVDFVGVENDICSDVYVEFWCFFGIATCTERGNLID